MDLHKLEVWTKEIYRDFDEKKKLIAHDLIKELVNRIGFLMNVGLDYLHLNLPAATLSGGEAQRIRLASQIGSELTSVLYILDEPSIGLHQRDNHRLINSLKSLRDRGNTVIVVEHDKDIMKSADTIIDIGPKAGQLGGDIMAQGEPEKLDFNKSITAKFLQSKAPKLKKTNIDLDFHISLEKASGNNLKDVSVTFP